MHVNLEDAHERAMTIARLVLMLDADELRAILNVMGNMPGHRSVMAALLSCRNEIAKVLETELKASER